MVRIAFAALAVALFGLVKAASSTGSNSLESSAAVTTAPTLYKCGLCQVTASSKTKIALSVANQCFQDVSAAITTEYAGNSKTACKLSTTKARRLEAQDGTRYLVKGVSFTNLKLNPTKEGRGFSEQGFPCSESVTGGVQCFDCTKMKKAST